MEPTIPNGSILLKSGMRKRVASSAKRWDISWILPSIFTVESIVMARILMKELEPFHLMFIEEPVLIENYEAFKDLRNHTVTPIATENGTIPVGILRKCFRTGMWTSFNRFKSCRRHIGSKENCYMAKPTMRLAPHCPLGPIALAACFQVDFMSINAFIQEQS